MTNSEFITIKKEILLDIASRIQRLDGLINEAKLGIRSELQEAKA